MREYMEGLKFPSESKELLNINFDTAEKSRSLKLEGWKIHHMAIKLNMQCSVNY